MDKLRQVSRSHRESVAREGLNDLVKRWRKSQDQQFSAENATATLNGNHLHTGDAF
jgi:hypothetical protein